MNSPSNQKLPADVELTLNMKPNLFILNKIVIRDRT